MPETPRSDEPPEGGDTPKRTEERAIFPDGTQRITVMDTDAKGLFMATTRRHQPDELPPIEGLTPRVVDFLCGLGPPKQGKKEDTR